MKHLPEGQLALPHASCRPQACALIGSGDVDRISALEENVAKRSVEVRELGAFMKTLSKKLHSVASGSLKLPKGEHFSCE